MAQTKARKATPAEADEILTKLAASQAAHYARLTGAINEWLTENEVQLDDKTIKKFRNTVILKVGMDCSRHRLLSPQMRPILVRWLKTTTGIELPAVVAG